MCDKVGVPPLFCCALTEGEDMFQVKVNGQVSEDISKAHGFKTTFEEGDNEGVKTSRREEIQEKKRKEQRRESSDLVQFADSAFENDNPGFEYDVDKYYAEAIKDLKSIE